MFLISLFMIKEHLRSDANELAEGSLRVHFLPSRSRLARNIRKESFRSSLSCGLVFKQKKQI